MREFLKQQQTVFYLFVFLIGTNISAFNGTTERESSNIEAVQLKVMTWNIWGSLNENPRYTINGKTGRKRVIEIIKNSEADIITMTETYGSAADIAKALNYYYYTPSADANLTIFSRYPLQDFGNIKDLSPFSFIVATVQLPNNEKVRVYNIWLTSGGRHIKEIKNKNISDEEFVIGDENRHEHLQELLKHPDFLRDLENKNNIPLIVAGDFNCVSHLDYTKETKEMGLNYSRILQTKASLEMEKLGFIDSYRFIHPKITNKTLGYTWTTVGEDFIYVSDMGFMPNTEKIKQEDRDPYSRIDYIYSAGQKIKPIDAQTITHHSSNSSHSFPEFPSDHGAVLTTFLIEQKGYNVKEYGAKGDAMTLDTKAIQAAIDKCFNDGGGKVVITAGTYLTGCIVLKSNVNLHLESGATLLGSSNKDDYKIIIPDFESRTKDLYVNRSIIYAENAENVSLTGNGIIDGNGKHKNYSITNPQKDRPFLARFVACKNLTIRDISMLESANWTCHLLGCEDVLIDGLKIKNSIRANRDGLDIDGCKNVSVSNCRIDSMDDAIVLKSTGPTKTQNINITNCQVSSHASGIKMGTETTGGFENITISNCVITNIPVYSGIALMIVDGGYLKNVVINNIVMDKVNIPFMIRLGNRARGYKNGLPTPEIGQINNIKISNIIVTNAGQTSHVTGLHKKKIENISFNNISIQYNKLYKGEILAYNKVPLNESNYPSGQLYGKNLPASGFYFRNIIDLKLNDVNIEHLEKDARIPIVLDNITNLQLTNNRAKTMKYTSLMYLRNIKNGYVNNCSNYGNSRYLTTIEKGTSFGIYINEDKNYQKQKAINYVASLSNKTYEDINGHGNYSFSNNPVIKGLPSYRVNEKSISIKLNAQKGKAYKLLFLNHTQGDAEDVIISTNGKEYILTSSDKNWGWNVVNITEICKDDNVTLKLSSVKNSKAAIYISKVVLIPVSETD